MKKKRLEKYYAHEGIVKTVRVMKLLTLLMILVYSANAVNGYSQQTKFSFSLNDATVIEIFKEIEDNSEYIFLYNEKMIDVNRRVNIDIKNKKIDSILEELFKNTGNTWKIYDRQIVIFPEGKTENSSIENLKLIQPEKAKQGTGSIKGHISDEKGLPMVGATIIIDQTTTGTITDANGNYELIGAPVGKLKVKLSFVGYIEEVREVTVKKGEVVELNVKMQESSVELSDVVAYGQARGQLAAINQQLNAKGITNVVSSEKLQELPDVNVAEAIGRLPGLMVQRSRGEGQKIIIRGLSPKYNTISIGGNIAPSTSTDDRSTDLNMISPEILGGVEVLKANTADKDAAGLGGTVNLTIREAPSGLKVSSNFLTGYSGHSNSLGNFKASFYASNRFLKDKLGIMITANAETAERNSDVFNVAYSVIGTPNYDAGETYVKPWIISETLQANIENRIRAGGSLLLDWLVSPSSTLKSSNFLGYLNRHIYDRGKTYDLGNNYLDVEQTQEIVNQLLYSNAFEGKHLILGSVFDWGVSRSESINERPYSHNVNFRKLDAFSGYAQGKSFDIEPPELVPSPENVKDYTDQYYFQNGGSRPYDATEVETGIFMNWETPFKIGEQISGDIKAGAKYRVKDRSRENIRFHARLDGSDDVNEFLKAYPDYIITTEGNKGKISLTNFLDNNYKTGEFLNDDYEYLNVDNVLDKKLLSRLYDDYLKEYYDSIPSAAKDNYVTYETVLAYYLMAELKLGKYITFIPGIRYEKTGIRYKAYIAEEFPASESTPIDVPFRDTTATNSYNHFLPQIHLKIKPTDWFDIRLAYTNTLSRPDYNQLAPKKIINIQSQTISLGNTNLKPALSQNYDLIFTFYKQKIGLLTFGVFYKNIQDFLWNKRALVLAGTATDPDVLDIPRSALGFTVSYPVNNKNKSTIKGFEFDLQSNMNFLPVKGFVFNMNFTLMDSKTKYPEVLVVRSLNPDYGKIPGVPRIIFINHDTAYVDRLISQPTYLANIGLGYDNKKIGLSARLSFNYQDDILISEQRRPDGADRVGTKAFYRWDFQANQRISKRLTLNINIANIFNQPDQSVRLITGYYSRIEYYGYLAQMGLKFNVF
ncbi:MAG: TonB-dependent receptor [Prolixibacteraceae bacterium]|nr:TonB-dependent receptor [Prolixibacteraceae bacterium]